MRFSSHRAAAAMAVATVLFAGPALAANIVDTAKADGHFTKLLAANEAAGTASLLAGAGPFTVFAPDDSAFAKIPQDKLAVLMKPENAKILKITLANHVVTGLLTEEAIEAALGKSETASVMAANTMPLIFKSDGAGGFTVNGAHIKKGPMRVDNGIVYVVDAVLLPAMPIQPQY